MIDGKILFYNTTKGTGLIITSNKQKYPFEIEQWNDFETMPNIGLPILFEIKNEKVISIEVQGPSKNSNLEELTSLNNTLQITDDSVPIQDLKTAIEEGLEQHQVLTPHKHKNASLDDMEQELNKLLTNSRLNIDSLNKKINLTSDIYKSIKIYINEVDTHLKKRMNYKKIDGRLDYLLAKRFLWTTFNNLSDIDRTIITPRIVSIRKDLEFMDKLYENFTKRTSSPAIAFEELFLSVQVEYKSVKKFTLKTVEKLQYLQRQEEILKNQRLDKEKIIKETKEKKQLQQLKQELKFLNGTYVDIVHMMARVQEIQDINLKRLHDFEVKYKEEFYKNFKKEAQKYKGIIQDILNAQAYFLDFTLWKEAKISKDVRTHFKKLSIDVELNTKTYLKYYLSTLDESKSSQSAKELYKLYEHLTEIYKEYIIVITSSVQDAMEYEQTIKNIDKSYNVKSFISELACIKFALIYTVKAIIIEEKLQTTNANAFLDYYHSHILSKPKILLIGNRLNFHSATYHIEKKLPANSSPRQVASALKDILTLPTS